MTDAGLIQSASLEMGWRVERIIKVVKVDNVATPITGPALLLHVGHG